MSSATKSRKYRPRRTPVVHLMVLRRHGSLVYRRRKRGRRFVSRTEPRYKLRCRKGVRAAVFTENPKLVTCAACLAAVEREKQEDARWKAYYKQQQLKDKAAARAAAREQKQLEQVWIEEQEQDDD